MGTTNHFCFEHNQLRNGTNLLYEQKPKQQSNSVDNTYTNTTLFET